MQRCVNPCCAIEAGRKRFNTDRKSSTRVVCNGVLLKSLCSTSSGLRRAQTLMKHMTLEAQTSVLQQLQKKQCEVLLKNLMQNISIRGRGRFHMTFDMQNQCESERTEWTSALLCRQMKPSCHSDGQVQRFRTSVLDDKRYRETGKWPVRCHDILEDNQ